MMRAQGYTLLSYGEMIADQSRIRAYRQAMQAVIRPGCTVLDIGAGTGILSLLACQFGAGHVHAVEPHDSIQLAKILAQANGFADRITFHQALSTAVVLPTPADVVVSDLRGVLPLFQHHIPTIVDARNRLLAPGARMLPERDVLRGALVGDPEAYRIYADPWDGNTLELDMRAGKAIVVNLWRKVALRAAQCLTSPQTWAILDYTSIIDTRATGRLSWEIDRTGTAYGAVLWFDAEFPAGARFTNAPGEPELVYGQAFFPLRDPVNVAPGDRVEIDLLADLVSGEYTWRWRTRVFDAASPAAPRLTFTQSNFLAGPLAPERLRRRAADHVPSLKPDGEADRYLLARMDGATPLETMARDAAAQFPGVFQSWTEALARAGELADRCGN